MACMQLRQLRNIGQPSRRAHRVNGVGCGTRSGTVQIAHAAWERGQVGRAAHALGVIGQRHAVFGLLQLELNLVDGAIGVVAHPPQSSSASRLTAGAAGFLNLSQSGDRPER